MYSCIKSSQIWAYKAILEKKFCQVSAANLTKKVFDYIFINQIWKILIINRWRKYECHWSLCREWNASLSISGE